MHAVPITGSARPPGSSVHRLLVGDALYLQTPFVGAVEDLGLDWVINLKENQPELLAETERLTDRAHDDSCSGLHSDPSVLPSPGSQPLQKLLFRFLRFGSEAGVSIYCHSSAGFQLKPSYNWNLRAPLCGRPHSPQFSPPEASSAASPMSFYSCKTSRRSGTRPMLAKSTNYLLSANGFAKSLRFYTEELL